MSTGTLSEDEKKDASKLMTILLNDNVPLYISEIEEMQEYTKSQWNSLKQKYCTEWFAIKWWQYALHQNYLQQNCKTYRDIIRLSINNLQTDDENYLLSLPTSNQFQVILTESCKWIDEQRNTENQFSRITENVSTLLFQLYEYVRGFSLSGNQQPLLDLLLDLLEESKDYNIKLQSLLAIDSIQRMETLCETQRTAIKAVFKKVNQSCETTFSSLENSFIKSLRLNGEKYPLLICSYWALDHFDLNNLEVSRYQHKLSRDGFSPRNDTQLETVSYRSPFEFNTGSFYFEVHFLSGGFFEIGWASEDVHYTFDVFCYANGKCPDIYEETSSFIQDVKLDTVVGCQLDASKGQIIFAHTNVTRLGGGTNVSLSEPYFCTDTFKNIRKNETFWALVKVGPEGSQVYVNFGQWPFTISKSENFLRLQEKIKCNNFDAASEGNQDKYRLEMYNSNKPFKRWKKIDDCWHSLEKLIECIQTNKPVIYPNDDDEDDDEALFYSKEDDYISYFMKHRELVHILMAPNSPFIENSLEDGQINVFASILSQIVAGNHEQRTNLDNASLYAEVFASLQRFQKPKQKPKQEQQLEQRYFCILLAILLIESRNNNFVQLIYRNPSSRSQFFKYLLSASISTAGDPNQRLFALIALRKWKHNSNEVDQMKDTRKFSNLLEKSKNYLKQQEIFTKIKSTKIAIEYQIHSVVHSFAGLFTPNSEDTSNIRNLSIADSSSNLLFTPDFFSVRCHYSDCTVRSECTSDSGVYFYEVLLLTSAEMNIGWATSDMDCKESGLGWDEFSIGLDGYQQCIFHDGESFEYETETSENIPVWKVGDIVGCLLDVPNQQFRFYLNGTEVPYHFSGIFSSEPYHAAVTLFAHQQVIFNFGQSPFKYPPKDIKFLNFHTLFTKKSEINDHTALSSFNLSGARLENVYMNIQSKSNTRDLTFSSKHRKTEKSYFRNKTSQSNSHYHHLMARKDDISTIPKNQIKRFYFELDKLIEKFTEKSSGIPKPNTTFWQNHFLSNPKTLLLLITSCVGFIVTCFAIYQKMQIKK